MKICKKVKFRSALEAQLAVSIAQERFKRGKQNRKENHWYFCPQCSAYHLSSHKPPEKKIKPKPDPNFKIGRGGRKIPIDPPSACEGQKSKS